MTRRHPLAFLPVALAATALLLGACTGAEASSQAGPRATKPAGSTPTTSPLDQAIDLAQTPQHALDRSQGAKAALLELAALTRVHNQRLYRSGAVYSAGSALTVAAVAPTG